MEFEISALHMHSMENNKNKSFFFGNTNRLQYKYLIRGPILAVLIILVYLFKAGSNLIDKKNIQADRIVWIKSNIIQILDSNKSDKFNYYFDSYHFDSLNVINAVAFIRNHLTEDGLKVEQIGVIDKINNISKKMRVSINSRLKAQRIALSSQQITGIIDHIDNF
ncbi:MAG: hypothetical protein IPK03_00535 [Bacteroidetes bacterium]|nr:hypothetical protein [Bacteroidota bacterium]